MALHALLQQPAYRVHALLTTVTEDFDRISMHGVRCSLLQEQAASLGVPLRQALIRGTPANTEYEARVAAALADYRQQGIITYVFGDLFLRDIRGHCHLDGHWPERPG